MLTKKLSREIEKTLYLLASLKRIKPEAFEFFNVDPALNLTFSLKQLKEMKLIPVINPNYDTLVNLLQNPKTKRILNLSLTPDIQNTLSKLPPQSLEVIRSLIILMKIPTLYQFFQ